MPSAATISKKTVEDVDLAGKTVLVRVDYNVPFRPGTVEIADDSRIVASCDTLKYLASKRCKIVLASHLGRPGGRVVEELRLKPVAVRLSQLTDYAVETSLECTGDRVREMARSLPCGGMLMLENLRFDPGEESNDPDFASALASLAEVFVNDAFGAAHRAHASTEGVAHLLPSAAGLLMARELDMLGGALRSPVRPFVAVLGGAKVSDKLGVLSHLAGKVDILLVGGGMAATFFKAAGKSVGDSLVEDSKIDEVSEFMRDAADKGVDVRLPGDVVVADGFSATASHRVVASDGVPDGWRIMDIGPEAAGSFESALRPARTVIWNGPMGVFEWEPFAGGTERIAKALAGLSEATTVVGGGSTAEAVATLNLDGEMTHVSTGGGPSLEFMEGKILPGVAALPDRD